MNALPSSAINPLEVADKLASIRNRIHIDPTEEFEDNPRLGEALWFVQWASTEAGGLREFSRRMVEDCPQFFVTDCMEKIGRPRSGKYQINDLIQVWNSIPTVAIEDRVNEKFSGILNNDASLNLSALRRDGVDSEITEALTFGFFSDLCRENAIDELPAVLRDLCTDKKFAVESAQVVDSRRVGIAYKDRCVSRTWWVNSFLSALYAMMDHHAERVAKRLAKTTVVTEVWDALDYAWHTRGFITIEGNTRFGKSEALRTWCDRYPGKVRYLAVPHSTAEKELLTEVAAAFRLPYTWSTPEAQLREEIAFILQFGGIGLAADEGQFMVPTRYGKGTSPHRLNWFRTQLVDRRVPCALCYTGQFNKDLSRYAKTTGYVVDQWLGRPKLRVNLPDELPELDTLAVVKRHLPWCSEGVMMRVAGRATASRSFLKAIEDVADRARWLAAKEGRKTPSESDALRAMEETLPEMESMLSEALPSAPVPQPPRARGQKSATPTRRSGGLRVAPVEPSADTEPLPVNRLTNTSPSLVPAV